MIKKPVMRSVVVLEILTALAATTAILPPCTAFADDPADERPDPTANTRDASVAAAGHVSMQTLKTPAGTRFGLFGEKPSSPAPTLFVFANSLEGMDRDRGFSETGRQLARHGWLYVTVDLPCHGNDHREGEPSELAGWAHRIQTGHDLTGPFVKRCVDVLDFLIANDYTDPACVAVCGTSRGGFCAFHFAAAESRVRAVVCISPVTNLLALREFGGVAAAQVHALNVASLAEPLTGRAIWMSIGHDDRRVGTDDCIATARQFMAAALKRQPDAKRHPVELAIGVTNGHRAIDDAYSRAARFLGERFPRAE